MNSAILQSIVAANGLPEAQSVSELTDIPSWMIKIPGHGALDIWNEFRHRAAETGFWPVILQTEGPEYGSSALTLDRLKDNRRGLLEMPKRQRVHFKIEVSPIECVRQAEAYPFESWVHARHDPQLAAMKYREDAVFYEGLGDLSDRLRRWADEIESQPVRAFNSADYEFPPRENRSPAQDSLFSIRYYNSSGFTVDDTISLLLVPTVHSWEVPAVLSYSTNEYERSPSIHVAALLWLWKVYGAELAAIGSRCIEVVPVRRPLSATEALQAAFYLCTYASCTTTSFYESPPIPEIAQFLLESSVWSFCWP